MTGGRIPRSGCEGILVVDVMALRRPGVIGYPRSVEFKLGRHSNDQAKNSRCDRGPCLSWLARAVRSRNRHLSSVLASRGLASDRWRETSELFPVHRVLQKLFHGGIRMAWPRDRFVVVRRRLCIHSPAGRLRVHSAPFAAPSDGGGRLGSGWDAEGEGRSREAH